MKRAPLLVLAGTVAGFVGVLTFHTRPVSATTPGGTGGRHRRPASGRPLPAGGGAHAHGAGPRHGRQRRPQWRAQRASATPRASA